LEDRTIHEQDHYQHILSIFAAPCDIYEQLNILRDWVNVQYPDFELYLEDVWNENAEGETHFEYILRSRRTLNEIGPLGYDVYKNHRDAKGVWHLDDYQYSVRLIHDPQVILDFIAENQK
jgi:hypothetical protein